MCLNRFEPLLKGDERSEYFYLLEKHGKNELNINARDQDGRTPLHCAAGVGNAIAVNFLLSAKNQKVDINALDKQNRTHFTMLRVVSCYAWTSELSKP